MTVYVLKAIPHVMTLNDWVAEQGKGSMSLLQRKTGLAYTTVWKAARGIRTVRYATAKLLSQATDGAVSVAELCEPSCTEAA